MTIYGTHFIYASLITLVVELPLLFLIGVYLLKIKVKKIFWVGLFTNLFSLPYLWFVFPLFIYIHNYVYVGEILVVLIEAIIFIKLFNINFKKSIFLSLVLNVASYFIGTLILG